MANAGYVSIKPGNIRNTIVCLAKRRREFNISDRYPFPTFTLTPELKGHQSSGARAPELWCPFKLTTGILL